MLKELNSAMLPIKFGSKDLYLRYNLNAMRYIEHYIGSIDEFLALDIETLDTHGLMHLLRAGLMDAHFEANESFIEKEQWDKIVPSVSTIGRYVDVTGAREMVNMIVMALIESLPEPTMGEQKAAKGK